MMLTINDVMAVETAASLGTGSAQTGASLIGLGCGETGEMYSKQAELWHPAGLMCIPSLPNAGSNNTDAAQVITIERSDQDIAIAFRDTRNELNAGNIKPGETVLYSAFNARVALKSDNSVTLSTKDGSGNGVTFAITPTSLSFFAAWGRLVFDNTGFHLSTTAGGTFDMGSSGFPGLGTSYCNINASQISVLSPIVLLGQPATGSSNIAGIPTALQAYSNAIIPILPNANVSGTAQPIGPNMSVACNSVFIGS